MLEVRVKSRLGAFMLDVAFDGPAGVTALFGRSGAGKTTVVNAVAGLLKPDAGRVVVGGRVLCDHEKGIWLPPHQRRVGYVFQEGRLFPHLDVRRNLVFGRKVQGLAADSVAFSNVVDLLGIGPLLDRRPAALSGGEKQRVAIGRALLSSPELLLLDEPLSALDEARKAEILPFLERLRDEAALPILYVSHSVAEVARLATKVVMLDQGRVAAQGGVASVFSDTGAVTAMGIREAGSVLSARVVAHHDDGLTELQGCGGSLFLPAVRAGVGTELRVRILAHDVLLARSRPVDTSALNHLAGEISEIREGDGPGVLVRIKCADAMLLARITRRSARAMGLAVGQPIHAVIKSVAVSQSDVGA
ncbi:molybdenum ABC transporter ATP-binding protein [Shimia biformata]|uniref:molybdenum ABC transporter ATP-binding protein n=1 Tax=Shimia biformata TaxID=1294299 RepID=UPI001951E80B|nr:molybdenum ABC transporter ATP-binding protein [Shimia biformata]